MTDDQIGSKFGEMTNNGGLSKRDAADRLAQVDRHVQERHLPAASIPRVFCLTTYSAASGRISAVSWHACCYRYPHVDSNDQPPRRRSGRREGHPDEVRASRRCSTGWPDGRCSTTSSTRRTRFQPSLGHGRRRAPGPGCRGRLPGPAGRAVRDAGAAARHGARRAAGRSACSAARPARSSCSPATCRCSRRGHAGAAARDARRRERRGDRRHGGARRAARLRPHRPRIAAGIARIVEERDASPAERAIREINTGIYAFDLAPLFAALAGIASANAQGEYYLTGPRRRSSAAAGRAVETVHGGGPAGDPRHQQPHRAGARGSASCDSRRTRS